VAIPHQKDTQVVAIMVLVPHMEEREVAVLHKTDVILVGNVAKVVMVVY
jgi:hypothetical protein